MGRFLEQNVHFAVRAQNGNNEMVLEHGLRVFIARARLPFRAA